PKDRALAVSLREGRSVTIAGMAKGSRMVHPRLATLLCVITTDVAIDTRLLSRALEQSVSQSFGRLTLDGDTSPNDAVLALANGVELLPDLPELRMGQTPVMIEGPPVGFDAKTIVQTLPNPEIDLVVDLHMGNHSTTVWTCTAPAEY